QGSCVVIGVERGGFRHIEAAGCRVVRIVEPEADVEGVGRRELYIRVETEDLIDEDRADHCTAIAEVIDLEIRLIPGKTEAMEGGVRRTIGEKPASLHREE